MNIRRYLAARMVGKPDQVLQKVKATIQRLDLAELMPVIKIEKKAKREFYIFLAVETEEEYILPDMIKQAIKFAGVTNEIWPLPIEEIKKMTANLDIDTHGFNELHYISQWKNEDFSFDDFELSETESFEHARNDPELGKRYNRLLYWLSSVGEGAWPVFARACFVLGLVDDVKKARRVFRKLRLLGHVECTPDGLRWKVCPSVLVLSPSSDFYFLCGQRTPKLEEFLSMEYDVDYIDQPAYDGPSVIRVKQYEVILEKQNLEAKKVYLTDATSLMLADILPDLAGWKELLPFVDRLDINNYSLEKWENDRYYQCDNFYYNEGRYEGQPGLYRLTQNAGNYSLNLYFDYSKQRWLKGDWYGLRFLDICNCSQKPKVFYNKNKLYLSMRQNQRWPMVYEKAIVLSSGLLPEINTQNNLIIYRDINGEVPIKLANKMNINLEVKEIV